MPGDVGGRMLNARGVPRLETVPRSGQTSVNASFRRSAAARACCSRRQMHRTWYSLGEATRMCRSCCSSPPRHRRRGSTTQSSSCLLIGCRRIRVTLISDSNVAYYSGMLPGCVAGLYKEKDIQIDLVSFSQWCKVRLHQSRCVGLDPYKSIVFTEGTSLTRDYSNQPP